MRDYETNVMALTAMEYAFADGALASAAGLPESASGWGLIFCEDERGLRYTLACDAGYLRLLLDIPPGTAPGTTGMKDLKELLGEDATELPREVFPLQRRGWPDQWTHRNYSSDGWDERD